MSTDLNESYSSSILFHDLLQSIGKVLLDVHIPISAGLSIALPNQRRQSAAAIQNTVCYFTNLLSSANWLIHTKTCDAAKLLINTEKWKKHVRKGRHISLHYCTCKSAITALSLGCRDAAAPARTDLDASWFSHFTTVCRGSHYPVFIPSLPTSPSYSQTTSVSAPAHR